MDSRGYPKVCDFGFAVVLGQNLSWRQALMKLESGMNTKIIKDGRTSEMVP